MEVWVAKYQWTGTGQTTMKHCGVNHAWCTGSPQKSSFIWKPENTVAEIRQQNGNQLVQMLFVLTSPKSMPKWCCSDLRLSQECKNVGYAIWNKLGSLYCTHFKCTQLFCFHPKVRNLTFLYKNIYKWTQFCCNYPLEIVSSSRKFTYMHHCSLKCSQIHWNLWNNRTSICLMHNCT